MKCVKSIYQYFFSEPYSPSIIVSIPDEIWVIIFKMVPKSLPALNATCHKFHEILNKSEVKAIMIKALYPNYDDKFNCIIQEINYTQICSSSSLSEIFLILHQKGYVVPKNYLHSHDCVLS